MSLSSKQHRGLLFPFTEKDASWLSTGLDYAGKGMNRLGKGLFGAGEALAGGAASGLAHGLQGVNYGLSQLGVVDPQGAYAEGTRAVADSLGNSGIAGANDVAGALNPYENSNSSYASKELNKQMDETQASPTMRRIGNLGVDAGQMAAAGAATGGIGAAAGLSKVPVIGKAFQTVNSKPGWAASAWAGGADTLDYGLQRNLGPKRNEQAQPTGEGYVPAALRPISGWFGGYEQDTLAETNKRDLAEHQLPNGGLTNPDAIAAYNDDASARRAQALAAGDEGTPENIDALRQADLLQARTLRDKEKTYGSATEGQQPAADQASQGPTSGQPAQQSVMRPRTDEEINQEVAKQVGLAKTPEEQAQAKKLYDLFQANGGGRKGLDATMSKVEMASSIPFTGVTKEQAEQLRQMHRGILADVPDDRAPVAAQQAPGTAQQAPGTTPQAPGTTPQAPGTTPQAPGTAPKAPAASTAPVDQAKGIGVATSAGVPPAQAQKDWEQAINDVNSLQNTIKFKVPSTPIEQKATAAAITMGVHTYIKGNKDIPDFAKEQLLKDYDAKVAETGNPASALAELKRLNEANVKGGIFGAVPQYLMNKISPEVGAWWGSLSGMQQIMLGVGAGGLITGLLGHAMGASNVGNVGVGAGLIGGGLGMFGKSLPGAAGEFFGAKPQAAAPAATIPAAAQTEYSAPGMKLPGAGGLARPEGARPQTYGEATK